MFSLPQKVPLGGPPLTSRLSGGPWPKPAGEWWPENTVGVAGGWTSLFRHSATRWVPRGSVPFSSRDTTLCPPAGAAALPVRRLSPDPGDAGGVSRTVQPRVWSEQQAAQDAGLRGGGWLVQGQGHVVNDRIPGLRTAQSAPSPFCPKSRTGRGCALLVAPGEGPPCLLWSPGLPSPVPGGPESSPRGPQVFQVCGHTPPVCSGFTRSPFTWDMGHWSQGPSMLGRA